MQPQGMYQSSHYGRRCSFEGCTKGVQKEGVCVTHGAKRKHCSHKGCANGAIRRGVCWTHGAKVKQCSIKACTKGVVEGGVCYIHRSKNSINANNNPSQEAIPELPSNLSSQLINHDDEEELNSWIWRSCLRYKT